MNKPSQKAVSNGYSIDHLIQTAYETELINLLKLYEIDEGTEIQSNIIKFMERRIGEIKKMYTK